MIASVPLQPRIERSFDDKFSDKLHSRFQPLPRTSKSTISKSSQAQAMISSVDHCVKKSSDGIVSMTHVVEGIDASRIMRVEASKKIVKGTIEKRKILCEYEKKFGGGDEDSPSIVTKKKGEILQPIHPFMSSSPSPPSEKMRPCVKKYYRIDELSIHNVIAIVLRESRSSLSKRDLFNLSFTDTNMYKFVPLVVRWLDVDYSSLRQPRLDYQTQQSICNQRVEMMNAAMVAFGLDPGKLVRYLRGEYTGESRDTERILSIIGPHISESDASHIRRILQSGCPAELQLIESAASKLEMMKRGNQKSVNDNPDIVREKLNKEERYSHIIAIHPLMCLFSPYLRHTAQGMVIKDGKDPRLVWDGSTKQTVDDTVLNEVTPVEYEAEITFGDTKKRFYSDLYNLRISYPDEDILLATTDVKACFRYPRVHPDLTGAFGFYAGDFYFLATAMVFGHLVSCPSWEPFCRAIESMTAVFDNRPDLVVKHRAYLNMIQWRTSKLDENESYAKAVACKVNRGVLGENGHPTRSPARIYVDDALLAAVGWQRMEMRLAATIEAIFTVLGEPEVRLRQCPLALDKWEELVVSHEQIMLGLTINMRTMTVEIPSGYRSEVLTLLNSTWHVHRRTFSVEEAQILTGKLARLAEGAPWVFHLMSHMYTTIAKALAFNKAFLAQTSAEFRLLIHNISSKNLTKSTCKDQAKVISFAMKQAAKMVHHSKASYFINKTMRYELEFFREMLQPDSEIKWQTPIAFLIQRTPFATTVGDSCLEGAGGYSIALGFWWHLEFPEEIKRRTLLFKKNNDDGGLISINVLEFITVIINYCAALHVFQTRHVTDDPNPVLLNVTDNTSALNWTLHSCKTSKIGRMLARFFCSFLINSPLGINSEWISTAENEIADDISRLKKESTLNNSQFSSFDYSTLKQRYPELRHCTFFQIEPEILLLIWDIVLKGKWPSHKNIQALKQKELGKLIS